MQFDNQQENVRDQFADALSFSLRSRYRPKTVEDRVTYWDSLYRQEKNPELSRLYQQEASEWWHLLNQNVEDSRQLSRGRLNGQEELPSCRFIPTPNLEAYEEWQKREPANSVFEEKRSRQTGLVDVLALAGASAIAVGLAWFFVIRQDSVVQQMISPTGMEVNK